MNTKAAEVSLRTATEADALCLGVLATQVFLDTYAYSGINEAIASEVREAFSTEAFVRILSAQSTFVTVAEVQGNLVGFAQTTIGTAQALAPPGKPAELDRLYVQEPYTHFSIGGRLLVAHEEVAVAHGAALLWLSLWVGNHRALRFYAKHGYKDHGLVFFHMGPYKIENRVYAKQLRIAA